VYIDSHTNILRKYSQTETDLKDTTEKYQQARDQASKAMIDLNAMTAQYKVNTDRCNTTLFNMGYITYPQKLKFKKKESEYNTLKDRISKLANEKAQAQKLGLKLLNPLPPKVLHPPRMSASKKSGVSIWFKQLFF
jgi:chromosome segregation ATPase